MSSSIAVKKNKLNMEFLKRTGQHIVGATGEYISEVMPTTGSTLSEAKSTISQVLKKYRKTTKKGSQGTNRLANFSALSQKGTADMNVLTGTLSITPSAFFRLEV